MSIIPLAEKMRPTTLPDVVGQDHILGPDGFITRSIQSKSPLSIILWGPPGCGKTTLAKLYAKAFGLSFYALSPIFHGITDFKKIIHEIENTPLFNRGTLLFIDEIHRFNKSQQDAFLPYLEDGTIILVGATAENPSFYLNKALLSRLRVLPLHPLSSSALEKLIERFERLHPHVVFSLEIKNELINLAQGDGRYLYNLLENLQSLPVHLPLNLENIRAILQRRASSFDKQGDQHYNLISALHKSVRGSDPQAALYWFARILEGGGEPLFVARRLIRMAAEDIGLADPQALNLAIAAKGSYEMLGSPEGELALAEVVVYLSLAPKSNAIYTAYKKARQSASTTTHLPPPLLILNAPNEMMRELEYGHGYLYDHDLPSAFSGQNYFPEEMDKECYYNPVERGFEREMKKRIEYFSKLRKETKKEE